MSIYLVGNQMNCWHGSNGTRLDKTGWKTNDSKKEGDY